MMHLYAMTQKAMCVECWEMWKFIQLWYKQGYNINNLFDILLPAYLAAKHGEVVEPHHMVIDTIHVKAMYMHISTICAWLHMMQSIGYKQVNAWAPPRYYTSLPLVVYYATGIVNSFWYIPYHLSVHLWSIVVLLCIFL